MNEIRSRLGERQLLDQDISAQADALAGSAIAVLFPPTTHGPNVALPVPSPQGYAPISPGTTKFTKPWLSMGRLVAANDRPDERGGVTAIVAQRAREANITPVASLHTFPIESNVCRMVLVEGESQREWIAYPVLDAVAGRRDPGEQNLNGESAFSVPFDSPDHDPRSSSGTRMLRIPFANDVSRPDVQRFTEGERIAPDEWFAHPDRGFVIVVHRPDSVPGLPAYWLSIDPNHLLVHREQIELVAIFETVSECQLEGLIRAYAGVQATPPEDE